MGRFSSGGGGGFKGGYTPRSRPAPTRPAPRREPPTNQTPSRAPAKTSTYSKMAQDMSFGIMRTVAKEVLSYVMRPRSNSNEHEIIETSSSTSASTNPQKMRSASTGFDDMRSRSNKCYEDMQNQIIGCPYGGSIYEWRSLSAVIKARSASVS